MKKQIYDAKKVAQGVEQILEGMGIDWKNEENFQETPDRVSRAFKEFTLGLYDEFTNIKTFSTKYSGMIFFESIRSIGLCPHHLLPINYNISFAYVPNGQVLGLSKIPRIIKHLSAKPILQEDLANDIVSFFDKTLQPQGIAVLIRGIHGCMKYRGVKEAEEIKTMEFSGSFNKETLQKNDFYAMVNKNL